MTPAVMMVGCSDYEDTEVTSPEADADAIGAYFKSSATSAHLSPEQTSFQVVLNRASFSEAVNVPVKVTANDDNFFSLSANQFMFDAVCACDASGIYHIGRAGSGIRRSRKARNIRPDPADEPGAGNRSFTCLA